MAKDERVYDDDDTRLMLKAAKGDEIAWATLCEKYRPILIDYVTSINGLFTVPPKILHRKFSCGYCRKYPNIAQPHR